jgi:hypothetical protein
MALFSVWPGVFESGLEVRREVNRKRFRLNLNGYALYHPRASHPEEGVYQVWTVRRSSLWRGLQMFELRNLAASVFGATVPCFHLPERLALVSY